MRNPTYLFALGLFVLVAAQGVQATQTVNPRTTSSGGTFAGGPTSWSVSRGGGQQLVFWGQYTSGTGNESGLGLVIQYDATKFTTVVVDQLLTKCLVQLPVVTPNGANSTVQVGWADSSQRVGGAVGWPGTADDVTHPCFVPPTCIFDPVNDPGCVPQPLYAADTTAHPVPTNLFRLIATTAVGFTSGTSTITITSSSKSSATGTAAFTDNTLVVTGIVPPPCNLDMDGDGAVTAPRDGVLLQRAMNPGITDANVTIGIAFVPGSIRTTGSAIRTYLNTFAAGNGATVLDVDGSATTTAPVDGNAIKRALNPGIQSANITIGLAVTPGTTGSSIRTYLNTNCGTSLTP